MYNSHNKNREKRNNRRNKTTKLGKYYKTWREGKLKISRNIGSRHYQTSIDKRKKIRKEYLRRTRKLLETRINWRNLMKRKNIWAVSLVRYSEPLFKWIKEELRQMYQRTSKLMMMHMTLQPRDDTDKLYVSRKEERGLISMCRCINTRIWGRH